MMTGKLSSSVVTALLFGIARSGSPRAARGAPATAPPVPEVRTSGAGGGGGSPAAGSGGVGRGRHGWQRRGNRGQRGGRWRRWRRNRRRCGGHDRARRRGRWRCRHRRKRRSGRNRGNGNGWGIRRNGRGGRRRGDWRCGLVWPGRHNRIGRTRRDGWQCGGRQRLEWRGWRGGRRGGRAVPFDRDGRRQAKRTSQSRWVRSCGPTCFISRPATRERHPSRWCSISTASVAPDQVRRDLSGWATLGDSKGFIAVFPNGVGNSWNIGRCCSTAQTQNVDDVGFVRAIIKQLQTTPASIPSAVRLRLFQRRRHVLQARVRCRRRDRRRGAGGLQLRHRFYVQPFVRQLFLPPGRSRRSRSAQPVTRWCPTTGAAADRCGLPARNELH